MTDKERDESGKGEGCGSGVGVGSYAIWATAPWNLGQFMRITSI